MKKKSKRPANPDLFDTVQKPNGRRPFPLVFLKYYVLPFERAFLPKMGYTGSFFIPKIIRRMADRNLGLFTTTIFIMRLSPLSEMDSRPSAAGRRKAVRCQYYLRLPQQRPSTTSSTARRNSSIRSGQNSIKKTPRPTSTRICPKAQSLFRRIRTPPFPRVLGLPALPPLRLCQSLSFLTQYTEQKSFW